MLGLKHILLRRLSGNTPLRSTWNKVETIEAHCFSMLWNAYTCKYHFAFPNGVDEVQWIFAAMSIFSH